MGKHVAPAASDNRPYSNHPTEKELAEAIRWVRQILDAAESSNQRGEDLLMQMVRAIGFRRT
jgi:hypothetical protein